MEKASSIRNLGRNTIVTVLISIALNPISILLGYYIGKTLQAPKLNIEYIEVVPEIAEAQISQAIVSDIKGDNGLKSVLERRLPHHCKEFLKSWEISRKCTPRATNSVKLVIEELTYELQIYS